MASIAAPVVAGQFDDAPGESSAVATAREGNAYIDTYDPSNEDALLDWPDTSDEEDEEEIDEEYDDNRVEDEDWEIAERDFTKQYNRLRQHAAVRTGNAQGTSSALKQGVSVAALPAVNHPKSIPSSSSNPVSKPAAGRGKDRTTDQLAALSKYNSRLAKIDVPYVMGVGVNRKGPSAHANIKDKSDRATNEQVLDPRTRLILFKMIGRGLIHEVNGCVSTGKEANVYHAVTPDNKHLAIKIYKTSILIFKDRDKYVTGEYRFRRGYSRNPRKMVRLWAEKEMRNLKRLVAAGINAPDPLEVRENVLVMSLVGDNEGWASPRLKDAQIPSESTTPLYTSLILTIRRMFHICKLVHADLSEYNILYHNSQLWIIDVSQSVEHDHPAAFDFLRNDLKNVEEFFGRLGVGCLGLRRSFDFVTREKVARGAEEEGLTEEEILGRWIAEKESMDTNEDSTPTEADGNDLIPNGKGGNLNQPRAAGEDAAHEDSVFLHSFIPRTLNEVYDPERDLEKLKRGGDLIYADTIGLVDAAEKEERKGGGVERPGPITSEAPGGDGDEALGGSETDSEPEDSSDEEAEEDDESKAFEDRKPRGHKHEDKDAKKERKKQVKAEQKERRKQKMPKAEKKRIIKKSKGG